MAKLALKLPDLIQCVSTSSKFYRLSQCKDVPCFRSNIFAIWGVYLYVVRVRRVSLCWGRTNPKPLRCPRSRSPACWPMHSSARFPTETQVVPAVNMPVSPPSTSTGLTVHCTSFPFLVSFCKQRCWRNPDHSSRPPPPAIHLFLKCTAAFFFSFQPIFFPFFCHISVVIH